MAETIDVTPTRLPERFKASEALVYLQQLELIQSKLAEWKPSDAIITIAEEFRIPDDDDGSMLQLGTDEFVAARAKFDEYEAKRKVAADVLTAWHRMNQSWFTPVLEAWKRVADAYSRETARRKRQLEEERRRAQAKIDEDARKARAAAEAKAAKERAEAEEAAAKLRRQAEDAAAAGRAGEAAKLAVQAENKLEQGEVRAQAAVVDASVRAPAVVLPSVPKTTGVNTRKTYDIEEEVDVLALAAFVVANPSFANLVLPNRPALRSLAIAQKDAFHVAGCKLRVTEQLVRSRA